MNEYKYKNTVAKSSHIFKISVQNFRHSQNSHLILDGVDERHYACWISYEISNLQKIFVSEEIKLGMQTRRKVERNWERNWTAPRTKPWTDWLTAHMPYTFRAGNMKIVGICQNCAIFLTTIIFYEWLILKEIGKIIIFAVKRLS